MASQELYSFEFLNTELLISIILCSKMCEMIIVPRIKSSKYQSRLILKIIEHEVKRSFATLQATMMSLLASEMTKGSSKARNEIGSSTNIHCC